MTRAAARARPSMTFEEFQAFVAAQPDGERWELVDGQAIMNAWPTDYHQAIVGNINSYLLNHKNARGSVWLPLTGHGVLVPGVPEERAPAPDILVRPEALTGQSYSRDPIVVFEVLSPSNDKADRAWRYKAYTSVPSIQQYVVVEQNAVRVVVMNRIENWVERVTDDINGSVQLEAIGVMLPMAEIYRWTGFDPWHSPGTAPG